MKCIVSLILLLTSLQSAQLILNRYEEKNQSVDIYHLVDAKPIYCHEAYVEGFRKRIVCEIEKPVTIDRRDREDSYFHIRFNDKSIVFDAKNYVKLLPIDEGLIVKETIDHPKIYRHWVIIGSRQRPEILPKEVKQRFNFPIKYAKKMPPYIGSLDLNGVPIRKNKGAIYLSKIEKLYRQKNYKSVMKLADQYKEAVQETFQSEIKLYRLRAMSKLAAQDPGIYDDLLADAKAWIEENPSNEHIPELYMFVVQSYLGKGRIKEGERYLNLLQSGFPDNLYTQRAQLFYADRLYKNKKRRNEALKIYKDVLYATKDLDTASLAALHIANAYIDTMEPQKAEEIFAKVLKSNRKFIREKRKESLEIAERFAKHEHYGIALEIIKLLEKVGDKAFREQVLKMRAYLEEKNGDEAHAIEDYSRYLKLYPQGRYKDFVKKHLDGLMIVREDQNLTKKLTFLNNVLERYKDNEIQKRALEEKVKILFQMKKYREILGLEERLKKHGLGSWTRKSAMQLALDSLKNGRCEATVEMCLDHNLTLERRYDEKLFNCYLKTGMYERAKQLMDQNIASKDLQKKLKWLYLAVRYYKERDSNKKVILTANDVLKLERTLGVNQYDDVLYDMAEAYYNLRQYDDLMLETVKKIEKRFPNDLRNIDLFMKVVRYAQKRKDIMLEVNYAKKVIDLKKRYKVKAYSPKIEILYAHGLQKIGKYKKALSVVLDLLNKPLTDAQKAEVLYLAGELSLALGKQKEAVEFYTKCGEIVKDSAWQKLCAENLEILTQ